MNAAVWFGAAIFLTFFVAPTVFSPVLKQNLGEVWPGVIASMLLERYFVIQYFCAIIALVHAFTEWIYLGKPLKIKSRKELIAGLKPHYLQYLREDNGDLPEGYASPVRQSKQKASLALPVLS